MWLMFKAGMQAVGGGWDDGESGADFWLEERGC